VIFDAYIRLAYLTSTAQKITTVLLIALLIIYELSEDSKTYRNGKKLLIPLIITLGIAVGMIFIQSVI